MSPVPPRTVPVPPAALQPAPPVDLADYERLAHDRLSHAAWEYFQSGSADEVTLRGNLEALAGLKLRPRVLVDVSSIDTRVRLFGDELAHPILLAPASTHELAHPDGERETARGAGAAFAGMVVSTASNRTIEEIAAVATQPLWFQLYVEDDREAAAALIRRAEQAGCRALCVTVDLPMVYARGREARLGPSAPLFDFPHFGMRAGPGSVGRVVTRNLSLTWKDLAWIKRLTRMPVLLKGVLDPEDARIAVQEGCDGLVVSNHGGRALDGVPAVIEALPRVADAVQGRIPLLADGGVRRGSDVLRYLACGASAVLLGRPYLHGLGVAGAEGVRHVVEILRAEFEAAMAMTGHVTTRTIGRDTLWT